MSGNASEPSDVLMIHLDMWKDWNGLLVMGGRFLTKLDREHQSVRLKQPF